MFQSIILVGGEEIISLMLSPALITAHLFLQRPKRKKLERKQKHQHLLDLRNKYPGVLLALLNLSPSTLAATENKKAEVHNCHKVGISKGISPELALCRRTVVYAQREDWMERPITEQHYFPNWKHLNFWNSQRYLSLQAPNMFSPHIPYYVDSLVLEKPYALGF